MSGDPQLAAGCTLLLALARLSDKQRHAVIGRFFRGLTFEQLGREMGVTRQAADQSCRNGLRELRRHLRPHRDQIAA